MRARLRVLLLVIVVAAPTGCRGGEPPVVRASETTPTATASVTASGDPDEARLAELRATDQFDEFAEHERAARADGARLAWENFAPIVDGERVEWTNKAELWDSIAPKIRDEALLLGPEYRKPLWNNNTAIPNTAGVPWNDAETGGRGHYAEFVATFVGRRGATERVWGFLIVTDGSGHGRVTASMPALDFREADYASAADEYDALQAHAWAWVERQERRGQ